MAIAVNETFTCELKGPRQARRKQVKRKGTPVWDDQSML